MDTQKVVFVNKQLGTRMAGLLRLPEGFNLSENYPAVVVTGPMLSVKEQAQSVYAERLTAAGFVTLVFDGTYFGESEGMPRQQELPDVKESDIEGAVDFLVSLPSPTSRNRLWQDSSALRTRCGRPRKPMSRDGAA